jgi:hypothetical protein
MDDVLYSIIISVNRLVIYDVDCAIISKFILNETSLSIHQKYKIWIASFGYYYLQTNYYRQKI